MSISAEVASRLHALIERFAFQVARCHQHASPDEVHDLRVSVRRLDQGLRMFGKWVPKKAARKIRDRLKSVLDAAGAVRDCDIALELTREFELAIGKAAKALDDRRDSEAARLAAVLDRLQSSAFSAKWQSRLELEPATPGGDEMAKLARKLLPRKTTRFIESGAELARHPRSRRRLHSFRISAKRFRYTLEPFAALYGAPMTRRIANVRKVQTVLGHLNDCVATESLLKDLGVKAPVLKPLEDEESSRLAEFQSLWPKLFSKGAVKNWVRFVERRPDLASPPR